MKNLYQHIIINSKKGIRQLAILIDPDKMPVEHISSFSSKINQSIATHIFVGGSEVNEGVTDVLVEEIKKHTKLPVILFPGDVIQITNKADGILFLSLISGRNPDYLIEKHINAVPKLSQMNLEVIPTGYILIENGKQTSVERVSNTKPIKRIDIELIKRTAKAGELLGMQLIYLEAGSGATHPIDVPIISEVKECLNIPLIVGGGIRSLKELDSAYSAGADLVVIGTAIEENESFFEKLKK